MGCDIWKELRSILIFHIWGFNGVFKKLNEIVDVKSVCSSWHVVWPQDLLGNSSVSETHIFSFLLYPSATDSNSLPLEKANPQCRDPHDHKRALPKSYLGNGGVLVDKRSRDDGVQQSPLPESADPRLPLLWVPGCLSLASCNELSSLSGQNPFQIGGEKTDGAGPRTCGKIPLTWGAEERKDDSTVAIFWKLGYFLSRWVFVVPSTWERSWKTSHIGTQSREK